MAQRTPREVDVRAPSRTVAELDLGDTSSSDDDAVVHGLRLVDEALDELGYEDAKAARLLAALGVSASAVVTGFFAGEWSPTNMTAAAQWCWFVGAGTVLLALGLVGAAAITRGGRDLRLGRPDRLSFYGHAARHPDVASVVGSLRAVSEVPSRVEREAERLWHLGRILVRKKRLLRSGILAAAVGLALCIGAAPVNMLTRSG